MIIIEHQDAWLLVEHDKRNGNGWANLKLINVDGAKNGKRRKYIWSFGWNGERISKTRDSEWLRKYAPQIHQWVLEKLVR